MQLRVLVDRLPEKRLRFIIPAHPVVKHGQVHLGRIEEVVDLDGRAEGPDRPVRLTECNVQVGQVVPGKGEVSRLLHGSLVFRERRLVHLPQIRAEL